MATFRDQIARLVQAGSAAGVQLVRVTGLDAGNRYSAAPLEFDEASLPLPVVGASLTVTNLAEPADATGALPVGADAVALDVEGRWVIFVRPGGGAGAFVARAVVAYSAGAYLVRPQQPSGERDYIDSPGAADLVAYNLAELSLGGGGAVDVGEYVLVSQLYSGAAATGRFVFDHPAYAKYLE